MKIKLEFVKIWMIQVAIMTQNYWKFLYRIILMTITSHELSSTDSGTWSTNVPRFSVICSKELSHWSSTPASTSSLLVNRFKRTRASGRTAELPLPCSVTVPLLRTASKASTFVFTEHALNGLKQSNFINYLNYSFIHSFIHQLTNSII